MAEDNESVNVLMNKLALLCDAAENIFPKGKTVFVFELNEEDLKTVKKEMLIPNDEYKQFKIDLSGTEIIFLPNELSNDEINNS